MRLAGEPPSPGDDIECAIGEGAEFASVCKLERVAGTNEIILHHPDGGFRRITFDPATDTLGPLDGADPLVLEKGEGVIQFSIGSDRYRLTREPPATPARERRASPHGRPDARRRTIAVRRGDLRFRPDETAAGGAAEWIRRVAAGRPVTVLCGPGNNGGDGYVIARRLREAGNAVTVVAPLEPATDAAKEARRRLGGAVSTSGGIVGDVLVDCLFGSGLARPLAAEHALLLRDLAARHRYKVRSICRPASPR